jgi:uncharacterized membrane protein YjgN (DUF898 family)
MSVVESAGVPSPRISWVHPRQGFLWLSLFNGLLRILTLGVYHFWGKTEVRQRVWGAVRIDGEPLEYCGTAHELLRGFVIVFALLLVPLAIVGFAPLLLGSSMVLDLSFQLAIFVLIVGLGGFGLFRARRYRLSRTRWRGIRGGLTGRSGRFAWTYLWTTALVPPTLGWIIPWRAATLQRALVNETRFGDHSFTFHGRSGPLYKRFWLVWVSAVLLCASTFTGVFAVLFAPFRGKPLPPGGLPPPSGAQVILIVSLVLVALLVFAMIRGWYSSNMLNYFTAETRYQGRALKLRATVPSLVWLSASNYLMRALTLGVLSPVAEARSMRYMIERLSVEGPIDWQAVGQNPQALMRGEGLAEAFNVDAF